ncbi:TRAPP II complex [Naematelia encephala]|uniref:TRAPP II complex n=1 Tax=Naematelia encephala TaxID=71784 RepID=A0A1Y2B996_9TREE|nr:TRAPP II complex [Naematelia encephala]
MTIPASSVQTVRVAGVASSPGILTMRGVSLRLTDGSATDVLLPVIDEKDREKRDKRKSRAGIDGGKVKHFGIDARFAQHEASIHDQVEDKYLECEVVVEQPWVWIKKTNMTHGTVMLYNGESSTIRLTLENSSSVPVDFIKLSFDDSSARDVQTLINEGDLSPEHAYELEWDVLNRPVFVWENEQDTAIAPGGKLTLSVRCLGKVGCTDGSIRIDYGYISRPNPISTSNAFYTRQITFPVLFTVYHTLEPHALDLTRLVSPSKSSSASNGLQVPNGHSRPSTPTLSRRQTGFTAIEDDPLRSMLDDKADGSEWCLLGLGVRNVYGVPFEIRLGRRKGAQRGNEDAADWDPEVRRLVPPGASERILFPVRRCALPEQVISQRIPSLTDRQYIVDKSKKSAEVVARERELFWYREELLNMLQATWIEPGSKRSGQLSLRDQIFSPALLDVFKTDDVDISLDILDRQGNKNIESNDFVDLCVKVTNRLERPFRPLIHIEPLSSSSTDSSWASASTTPAPIPPRRPPSSIHTQNQPHRNILFDGTLTNLFPLLQPGQTGQRQVGVVFLASGTYAFRAAVEEVRSGDNRAKIGDGDAPNLRFSPIRRVKVV